MGAWSYILVGLGLLTATAGSAIALGFAAASGTGEYVDSLDHSDADERLIAGTEGQGSQATDDQTALGRMLASEDQKSQLARVVIGWVTLTKARNAKKSLYELLTRGNGYGRQKRPGEKPYYASTARPAREEDLALARALIEGDAVPPEEIKRLGVAGWVERGQLGKQTGQALDRAEQDARLLVKQWDWQAGIYGRIRGTEWYLYSKKTPKIPGEILPEGATREQKLAILAQVANQTLDRVAEVG